MFGFRSEAPGITETQRTLLREAAARLGFGGVQWRRRLVAFEGRGEPRTMRAESVERMLRLDPFASAVEGAMSLAAWLEVAPPAEAFADAASLRAMLRPRVLHPRELKGPRRAMCRREIFGGLIHAIAVGRRATAPLVTTAALDRWKASFEDAAIVAADNLAREVTNRNILEVQGAPGLLALLHDREQASAAAVILEHLFPPDLLPHGVVFAVPGGEVLLAFPVIEGSGADGLAAIVQAAFSMAHERPDPLSDRAFWRRAGAVIDLPMTAVEDRASRRIHIEARGAVEDLLRILGAIE